MDTIHPDGTGLSQVAAGAAGATWSPDGQRIDFNGSDFGGGLEIANAGGSGAHRLTTASILGASGPAWSPDGTMLAFTGSPGFCT